MTYAECLHRAAGNAALVAEFDRLTGSELGHARSPIDRMIDEATGREWALQFAAFVFEAVWLPLAAPARPSGEATEDER